MCNIRQSLILTFIALVSISISVPPSAQANDDASTIGEVKAQKLQGFTYFHATARVNLVNFPFKIAALLPELQKAMDSVHARATGPMIIIYRGTMEDATADYDVEFGFPVAEKTPGVKDFQVRQVPDYDCMSVLHTGPLGGIMAAYEKLIPAAEDTGRQTNETRLMLLYVEGAASPNNILHVSVGVRP